MKYVILSNFYAVYNNTSYYLKDDYLLNQKNKYSIVKLNKNNNEFRILFQPEYLFKYIDKDIKIKFMCNDLFENETFNILKKNNCAGRRRLYNYTGTQVINITDKINELKIGNALDKINEYCAGVY